MNCDMLTPVCVVSETAGAFEMKLLIYGAGAIGQFLGAMLAAGGTRVHLLARASVVEAVAAQGLVCTDLDGSTRVVRAGLSASTGWPDFLPDLVLLTVKGPATAAAAAELAHHLPPGTPVLSFQNGVENVIRIQAVAPMLRALAGMVPYNVVQVAPGQVRRTSEGALHVARAPITEQLHGECQRAGLALALRDDITAVQWGKLLLNLNNPLNAISGLPLRQQLLDTGYRRILARLQDEALAIMAAAGIRPARVTPVPPRLLPSLLRLPTPIFRMIAARMLKIAPDARSSMYDDRIAGRPTEIDDLCGAVVRLAAAEQLKAPLNAALQRVLLELPQGDWLSARDLDARLPA